MLLVVALGTTGDIVPVLRYVEVVVATHSDLFPLATREIPQSKVVSIGTLSTAGNTETERRTIASLVSFGATEIITTLFGLDAVAVAAKTAAKCSVVATFVAPDFAPPSDLMDSLPNDEAVRHWAWRLFLDDHGSLREELGLDPWPAEPLPNLVYLIEKPFLELAMQDLSISHLPSSVSVAGSFLSIPLEPEKARQVILSNTDSVTNLLELADAFAIWVINSSINSPLPVSYSDLFASGLVRTSINHGGLGTITQASQTGLRQVIVPFIFDQRLWGERLSRIGVAKCASEDIADMEVGEWILLIRWLCLNNPTVDEKVSIWRNKVLAG
ncbi:hypothetical protein BCR33DRAFT_712796 [Rhizoclosmatium globosum]|uniref:UDP-Glycosyltransferase/glycogen phosphorylase n=1 Tax=Rhizoclosmatium globosum TaxID=329046 RepID=A0A1Y2CV25_9FUNG|nr:hypothetical protein BCR33DRAFT_712796 [Rhizoclosmatium globosum]|eukprot:ORY50817.1 hypothetical protein BCR33DRAFT_712796 [Rhizoclosmatium globosum]